MVFMCTASFKGMNKEIREPWYVLTYVVDVRNVVFVNSNCLLKKKEVKISFTTLLFHNIYTLLRRSC